VQIEIKQKNTGKREERENELQKSPLPRKLSPPSSPPRTDIDGTKMGPDEWWGANWKNPEKKF